MKFVAAARLRRAQEAAIAARPYANELSRLLRSIMARIDEPEHPLLAKRPEERILAIVLTGERGLAGAFNANILRKANDFLRERRVEKLLATLLPKYIEAQVLRAMLESSAAEYAARMAAMESATRNAGEVIQALTLHMNKVRQAAITKEIIEIVSGASHGA